MRIPVAFLVAVTALQFRCGPAGGNPDGGAAFRIGPGGGIIEAQGIKVTFPRSALLEDVEITVFVQDDGDVLDPERTRVSVVYRIEPQGTTFARPVSLVVSYEGSRVPAGVLEAAVDIRRTDATKKVSVLPNTLVDDRNDVVQGEIDRLGTFWSTAPIGPKPSSIRILPPSALIRQGETVQFSAEVRDQAGRLMPGQPVIWSVSASAVTQVSPTGLVTGVGPGTSKVIATVDGVAGQVPVSVRGNIPPAAAFWFENPQPMGNDVFAVRRDGADLIVAGAGGTVARRSAGTWRQLHTSADVNLFDVGIIGTEIVAVGVLGQTGFLVRHDGTKAAEQAFPGAKPVALGIGPNGAMAVGADAKLLYFDGTVWSAIPSPVTEPLLAAEGTASGFTVVGNRGAVYDFGAGAWTPVNQTPLPQLLASAAVKGGVAYGVGGNQLRKFSAGAWATDSLPAAPAMATLFRAALAGSALAIVGNDLNAGRPQLLLRDAGTWKSAPLPPRAVPLSVSGTSATDVVVGGAGGQVLTFDGTTFTEVSQRRRLDVTDVAAVGSDAFAIAADCRPGDANCALKIGVVLARDAAGTWNPLGGNLPSPGQAIAARSASEIFVVGPSSLAARYDGQSWALVPSDVSVDYADVAICGQNVLAVGTGRVMAYDGTKLGVYADAGGRPLAAVWCKDANTAFVGGDYYLARLEGGIFRTLDPTRDNVNPFRVRAVWSPDGTELFACGEARYVVRYDGAKFSFYDQPAGLPLLRCNALWGSSVGDLYLAGERTDGSGLLLRFDGAIWERMNPGLAGPVRSVGGDGQRVYVTGANGSILRGVR